VFPSCEDTAHRAEGRFQFNGASHAARLPSHGLNDTPSLANPVCAGSAQGAVTLKAAARALLPSWVSGTPPSASAFR